MPFVSPTDQSKGRTPADSRRATDSSGRQPNEGTNPLLSRIRCCFFVLRDGGNLRWLLGDHLGSTAYTANGTTESGEVRYKPWGSTRYTTGATIPTTYRRVPLGAGNARRPAWAYTTTAQGGMIQSLGLKQ
jgi:hypothetical protein